MLKDFVPDLIEAIDKFKKISDWKDSAKLIEKCTARINELQNEEKESERLKAISLEQAFKRYEDYISKKSMRVFFSIAIIFTIVCISLEFIF